MKILDDIDTLEELRENFGDKLPIHLGLILDGNRRWIKERGINDTLKGHLAGYNALREILNPLLVVGIHYVSVYALSIDNVKKRSKIELQYIFKILSKAIKGIMEEPKIKEHSVKIRVIGRIWELPKGNQDEIEKMHELTKYNNKNFANICVMYDGQEELVDAIKSIVESGIEPQKITKEIIKQHLYTKNFPEVDYIIRTGMEDGARISGFLLWDASYAEFKFRKDLWPDYNKDMLLDDLKEYITRNRRKGA